MFHFSRFLMTACFLRNQPRIARRVEHRPKKTAASRLARNRCAPVHGDALHALQRFFEQISRAREREPQIVLAAWTKRSPGNSGDPGFFKQQLLQLFGGKPRIFDVHPRVERSIRRLAAKSWNARETADK